MTLRFLDTIYLFYLERLGSVLEDEDKFEMLFSDIVLGARSLGCGLLLL